MWYRSRILSSCKRKSLMRPEDSQLRASCCFLHSFGITRLAPKSWKLKSTTSANSLNCLFSFSVDFVLICRATITVNGPVDAIYKNNGSCLVKVKDHLTPLSLSLRCRNKNSKNVLSSDHAEKRPTCDWSRFDNWRYRISWENGGRNTKTPALVAGAPFSFPLLPFLPPPSPSPLCVCHAD